MQPNLLRVRQHSRDVTVRASGDASRAQAMADRIFVPVSDELRKAGAIKVPVALSSSAWEACVEWAEVDTEEALGVVLMATRDAICALPAKAGFARLTITRPTIAGGAEETIALRAVVGPGDELEPVLTIYLEGEF